MIIWAVTFYCSFCVNPQARDLANWSAEMQTEMLTEETVQDVASVDALRKRHQELKAEIDTREETFASVVETGQNMIEDGHFASQDVSGCSKSMNFVKEALGFYPSYGILISSFFSNFSMFLSFCCNHWNTPGSTKQ